MHAHGRLRARRPWLPIVGAAIAVALVCGLAAWRPWVVPSAPVAAPVAPAAAVVAPAPLALPEHARVLIFGDSWVYGQAATVPTLGFAYLVSEKEGWRATVDGVRGSGYLKPGLGGGAYGQRIAALRSSLDPDLVIIEGSINDRRLPAAGYRGAVTQAWDALAHLYPKARILILGPAPQVLPLEKTTARIDADLADLAAARGWWYISPIAEQWITRSNYAVVIDTGAGKNHPSTAGHAYLAKRLEEDLAKLAQTPDAAADAPRDGSAVTPSPGGRGRGEW